MKKSLILPVLLFAVYLNGCKKDKEDIDYQTLAQDAALSQNLSEDLFNTVDNESKNGQYSNTVGGRLADGATFLSVVDTCAVVTLNTNGGNWPMTLTIDFGQGCTDAYNVVRKGLLTITYSAPYRDSGSVITVIPSGYYVNDYKIEGTKTIENLGRNADGYITFRVKDINGKITKPDGGIVTWNSERTNVWVEGESTTILDGLAGICDDKYHIYGYLDGIASDGTSFRFEASASDPLIKKVCCVWVQGGTIDIFVNNNPVASIDYGDGTSCDWNANLSYGGNTYVIIIR